MSVKKGRINEDHSCFDCGTDLRIDVPANPGIDLFKIVCSECGAINKASYVRLQQVKSK